jgi:hypothetical protein
MRIAKYAILVSTILLLTACATAKFQAVDDSKWKGLNISQVESKWGAANQIAHTRDGNSYYVYTTSLNQTLYHSRLTNYSSTVSPGTASYAMPITMQRPDGMGNNMQLYCTTVFETNSSGMIISANHQGSNCMNPALLKSISQS